MGKKNKRTSLMVAYELLCTLDDHPCIQKTDLAQVVGLNGSQIKRYLSYLVAAECVEISDDVISLTEKGVEIVALLDRLWRMTEVSLREGPLARDYNTTNILRLLENRRLTRGRTCVS